MARPLSPIRIARARRTGFADTAETQEIDFNLGLRQGIEIHAVEFGFAQVVPTLSTTDQTLVAFLSLHAETGALEGALDSFPADNFILNSEIIAQAALQILGQDEAATRGGSAAAIGWLTPNRYEFSRMIGQPLIVATNLTFRGVTSSSNLTVTGGHVAIYHRYVELTDQELAAQFVLRR